MGPKKGPDGTLAFVLPMGDKKLPGIAVEDIGRCAYGVFERPELIGKTHRNRRRAPERRADGRGLLSKALGRPVVHAAVTPEAYRGFGFPGADDLGNMFQFKADFEPQYCASRDLALSRSLNPQLQTFAQWLAANASRIPLES